MQVFLIIALLIAILAVIFAIQNTVMVTVTFLFWKFDGSLALVLLLAVLTGVLISLFASLPSLIKNRINRSTQKKKTKDMETRLADVEERYEAARQELELYQVPPLAPSTERTIPPVVPPAIEPEEKTDVVIEEENQEDPDQVT